MMKGEKFARTAQASRRTDDTHGNGDRFCTPDPSPVLQLHGLAVGHGARPLVSGIDLAVRPGTVVALIGPNGSGKTTILRTVAGQLKPLAGSIEVAGADIAGIPPAQLARTMACLFTDRPTTELLTCKDVVEAGRYPFTGRLGVLDEEDEHQIRAIMEETGTWELRDRDFAHMSDGQRQRALIARALVQEPRVLLLDEPTSYLDIRAQLDMLKLLRDRARTRGIAVIASLHEIDLAQKAADTVVCVRAGRVVCQGSPDAIFTSAQIEDLYGLAPRSFNDTFGSFEMPRPAGAPRVFVIAGGGSGASAFRALQRAGIPFATGVLHRHDVDGALARGLASCAIFEKDMEPVGAAAVARARTALAGCEALICCRAQFGTMDARNAELIDAARELGIPIFDSVDAYKETNGAGEP